MVGSKLVLSKVPFPKSQTYELVSVEELLSTILSGAQPMVSELVKEALRGMSKATKTESKALQKPLLTWQKYHPPCVTTILESCSALSGLVRLFC